MMSFKLPFFFSPIAYNYYHYCLNNTLNGNLSDLSGWIPYSNSFNLEFINGMGTVTIPGRTILATSLAVWSIWSPDFNGMVSAVNGKLQINGYQIATPVNGVQWIALAGLIKVR